MNRLTPLLVLSLLTLGGCPEDPPGTAASADTVSETGNEEDAGPADGETGDVAAPEVAEPDAEPDLPEDIGPPPVPVKDAGEAVEGGLLVWPEALEGNFVYGLGTPPSSRLARWGSSAAGLFSLPAIVEVGDGLLTIRALDRTSLEPVPGPQGALEVYRVATEPDGRYRIDLTQPIKSVDVVIFGDCRFTLQEYALDGDAAFADGLITWPAEETYRRQDCPWGGNTDSTELHVHFLRRADANPNFVPRAAATDAAFGFFTADTPTETLLTRMPSMTEDGGDGVITYYLSESIPDDYRDAVSAAFEAWNDTIETALGQRPFVLEDAPPGAVAWDPRYRMVFWDESNQGSGGAIAPFIEDPFTGELFETYVVLWLADLDPLVATYQNFIDTYPDVDLQPAIPAAQALPVDRFAARYAPDRSLPPNALQPRSYPRRPFGHAELAAYMRSPIAVDLTDAEVAQVVVTDFLVHEIGHNLGLRHNFIASADHDHTPEGMTATSTMDYVVGMLTPGPYDTDAIRYAYGSGAEADTYLYCSDEDIYDTAACLQWDFAQPLLWTTDQIAAAADEIAVDTPWQQVQETVEQASWTLHFHTTRLMVNTGWESWGADPSFDSFAYILDQIACPEPCASHDWFRAEWTKRILATSLSYTAGWGPGAPVVTIPYPELDNSQSASLYELLLMVLMDPTVSLTFKTEVVEFVPGSGFGASETLLNNLLAGLQALDAPSADEQTLIDYVTSAKATLEAGGN